MNNTDQPPQVRVTLSDKGKTLATVLLQHRGIEIRGFRVMQSDFNDGLNVIPPSIPSRSSSRIWIVRILDPNEWKDIQALIKAEYLKVVDSTEAEQQVETVYINPDDIPL